jgi:hypothetical protein
LRQCYHAIKDKQGDFIVLYEKDSPLLYKGGSADDLESTEQMERMMWQNGEDVYAEVSYPSKWSVEMPDAQSSFIIFQVGT